jgi:alanine racemase
LARPIRARIDLAAIEGNYRLGAGLAPAAKTLAVVKADGYGHGAVRVAQVLAPQADGFGVASLEEALALRQAGITGPILLMAGFFAPTELAELVRHRLDTVVHCTEQLEMLLAARLEGALRVWLKMDSGMHRLGFAPESFGDAHRRLRAAPQVSAIVLMSHFARADELEDDFTARQMATFRRSTRGLEGPSSLAKSAAVLAWPDSHSDWNRLGIVLYGVSPLDHPAAATAGLEPAMELVSEIIAVRDLRAGEAIGYGGRYVCERNTRIGVVAAGYADGYPRHARDGTPVLVDGRRARIAGRVSMDLITVDLEGLDGVAVGDQVEFWGKSLPAREVADACGTIPYELFTGVAQRVPRVYHRGLR